MRWQEMTAPEIGALDRERTVLLLPVGSVEQHGNHMPVGTDTMLAQAVCLAAADRFDPARAIVLPPPWYGFSAHHMRLGGTITLPPALMIELIGAIADSVVAHGFRRLLVVNGHGGNGGVIDVAAATLGHRYYGRARVAALTYFLLALDAVRDLRDSPPGGMGHACEFETSLVMHLHPDLVKIDRAVPTYPDAGSRYLPTDLLDPSRIRTYLDFRDLSPTGTLGDPTLATPEKGARFFEAATGELAAFLADFVEWPVASAGGAR